MPESMVCALANFLCIQVSVPCSPSLPLSSSLPLSFSLPPSPSDVSNAEFICGKAEDVLPDKMTKEDSPAEVVGIADPPRAGLREWQASLLSPE